MARGAQERAFVRAYLSLGSNLGDRVAHLQLAVDSLAGTNGVRVAGVSQVYETAPVGGPPQDAFLNAVVAVDTELDAHDLLHRCQEIEALAARVRVERWGPRTLDVDVLLVDDVQIESAELTVPHPRMWDRGFVLAPLRDVAPALVDVDATWEGVGRTGIALRIPPLV